MLRILLASFAILSTGGRGIAAPPEELELARLRQQFAHPPDEARVIMRWWWFGAAVQRPELERELKVMKEAGIGGVEIQPVYPLELDDPESGVRNLPYLSDEFRQDIGFIADLTARLGMRMDVTLSSGWPFGGPQTPITEGAGRLRIERLAVLPDDRSVPVPALENGERLLAIYLATGERRQFTAAGAQRLTAVSQERVTLPKMTDGPHVVLFFIASHTGQQVKRAAVGAEGFVLDHYSRAAIEHHLHNVADPLLQSFGGLNPYSVFSDSLEVFASDWTANFPAEFKRRRGYDLDEHWMALVADDDPDARSVRHDWGKTLTELAEDNYLKPIAEWAHAHGTKFRSQTYGEPPAILSSNELVDLPEGEAGPRWRTFSTARWASSASHIYGRAVTSAETWTWLHSPAFRATPLDMKAEADLHFLQGINQLVGHGWPYSPEHGGEPGWHFYAAAALNEHNPWFPVMPEITSYVQRLSFLLRQGRPANDVAVYLPTDDAWANFRPGKASVDKQMEALLGPDLIPQILDSGYNFDFVDDRAIASTELPWKIMIIPGAERMPRETLQRLNQFEAKGGHVIATRRLPALAPGFVEGKTGSMQVAALARQMKFVATEGNLGEALKALYAPDLQFGKSGVGAVGFIHRKLSHADVYFLANTSNRTVMDQFSLRTPQSGCEQWNPFSGETHAIKTIRSGDRAGLPLTLAPYESTVLVFSDSIAAGAKEQRTAVRSVNLSSINLSDDWKVTFVKTGKTVTMPVLRSWTEDETTRFYSGDVVYERSVTLERGTGRATLDFGAGQTVAPSGPANAPGMRALLESPVRESAVVYVNGKRAGTVWHPPYELPVGSFLHRGPNQLRIVVANTAINEISGTALPSYKLLNLRYGERFVPQGFDTVAPLPSGILGPVQLHLEQGK